MLKENYKKPESDTSVSKTISSLLTEQMINVEKECWSKAQYSRRECLEVVWITSSVNLKDFEGKVCTFFNRIDVAVKPGDIEACHRFYNDKKQLSNFLNVKSVNKFYV